MRSLALLAFGAMAYSYLGYGLVLVAWAALAEAMASVRFLTGGPDRRRRARGEWWPSLTVVVAAHDEERWIQRKVENCLSLDYPADRLEVLIGCDGCTDRTGELARAGGDPRVVVVEAPRGGKAAMLARLVASARGEVLLLTDANVLVEPGAAKALARHFADRDVGAVVGRLRLFNRARKQFEESLYWKYETVLKYYEGKRGCVLGANGGLYAVRRALFPALSPSTIVEDFVVPVQLVARGWRVPYEPEAVGHEETADGVAHEFERRARIGAGDWQALALVPALLNPRAGFLHFAFVSHKLLRWVGPLLLGVGLALSVALAAVRDPSGALLLAAQAGFYGLAAAGWAGVRGPLRRPAAAAWFFVAMNAALAVGLWRFLRGRQPAAWDRTDRGAPARAA